MKCRECGEEVANVGELKKHKQVCPAKGEATQEVPQANAVIPWDRVASELKVLSKGTPLTFRIIGVVTADGIEVKEVHPDRR